MNVLVTGANGRIGQYAVKELHRHGYNCVSLDRCASAESMRIDLKQWKPLEIAMAPLKIGAILHLAAIPRPSDAANDTVFANNVASTHSLLGYAVANGISKVVCASSEAVLGVAYSNSIDQIKYLPVDEQHPVRPTDPYSMSKITCELLCDGLVATNPGMSITTLRFAWVLCPDTYREKLLKAQSSKQYALSKMFSYSDIRDVAVACRLAIESRHQGHERLYIASPDNLLACSSRQLSEDHFPNATCRFPDDKPVSLLSCTRAKELIGYTPNHSWKSE